VRPGWGCTGSATFCPVGRPRKLATEVHLRALAACLAVGFTYKEAGRAVGVSRWTIHRTRRKREPDRMAALIAEEIQHHAVAWRIRQDRFPLPDGPEMSDEDHAKLEAAMRRLEAEEGWR
jgi:hypothetical protein